MKYFKKIKKPVIFQSRASVASREICSSYLFQNQEQGFALLLVTFIIALISILIIDFTEEITSYQNSSRQYVEKVDAGLRLKSSITIARIFLEIPKIDNPNEDSLRDSWNLVAAYPLEGFIPGLRIMIVDESGKIDINSLSSPNSFNPNPGTPPQNDSTIFWKNAVKDLLTDKGFQKEQFDIKSYRTLGNQAYEASTQVAIISDWIDQDKDSFYTPGFDGEGIESSAEKTWFFNRRLKSISELAYIPGMTLEKIQVIAPLLKTTEESAFSSTSKININTAPYDILRALGFEQSEAIEIMQKRQIKPFDSSDLTTLLNAYALTPRLSGKLDVKSTEFCLYSSVKMPLQTYWLKSLIKITTYPSPRKTKILSTEFY